MILTSLTTYPLGKPKRGIPLTVLVLALLLGLGFAPAWADDDDDDNGSRAATVLQARASLPSDGTSIVCILTSKRDVIILSVYTDNTPTVDGANTAFDWEAMTIAGSTFAGTSSGFGLPITGIGGNRQEMRDMLRLLEITIRDAVSFGPIPLQAKKEFVVTFDTENGLNDVELDVILGVIGAKKARLRCGEADSGNHDDDNDDDEGDD